MIKKQKAKRKLFDFDFSEAGARVDLVGKAVGGAANGYSVLLTKSCNTGISPENPIKVSKALQQVQVSLSMEEFLRRFFGLYYDDAELLTKLLGFETEYEAWLKDNPSTETTTWLEDKVSKFTLMKSLNENPNQVISDEDYIEITNLQYSVEKSLEKEEEEKQMAANANTVTIEKARFTELETKETELTVAVEKAANLQLEVDSVKLENDTLKAEIKKSKEDKEALEILALKEEIKDLVEADKLEKVAKSLFVLKQTDVESADALIQSLQAKKAAVENSDLFKETTHSHNVDVKKANNAALAEALKQPY